MEIERVLSGDRRMEMWAFEWDMTHTTGRKANRKFIGYEQPVRSAQDQAAVVQEAGDEEVISAARAAYCDEFLRALPEGYNTFLGERGVRLSGGQRQRIAIARAVLKNPQLLLLYEATSALDAESERIVQAALEAAMRDRTTLVIAHRLATVQRADRIVVLDHGMIVEEGTHASLVASNWMYARLAALQFND